VTLTFIYAKHKIYRHLHDPSDYMLGDTRIVCNPRGYMGHEPRAAEFELKYLDI